MPHKNASSTQLITQAFQTTASCSYKAIIATTATIPANTLPFITRSWPPSLSAPLLLEELEELPSPCENEFEELEVAALPPDESVAEALPAEVAEELLESSLPELPEWLSVPGPDPVRPGTVCTVELAEAPDEADDADAPRVMFVPVARKEDRTVSLSPSTTVLFVPATLL